MSALARRLRKAVHAPGDGDAVAVAQQVRYRRVERERVTAGLQQQRTELGGKECTASRDRGTHLEHEGGSVVFAQTEACCQLQNERQRSSGQLIMPHQTCMRCSSPRLRARPRCATQMVRRTRNAAALVCLR
jgi:hypothetical protein